MVVNEGVTAAGSDAFQPGFQQRVVWDAEGQPGDDHRFQRLARQVDSLPETLGSEQNGARFLAEPFEHQRAGHRATLAEQGATVLLTPVGDFGCGALEHGVTGEQHQGAAVAGRHVAADRLGTRFRVVGSLLRVRHLRRQDQATLRLVIEGAAQPQVTRVGDAQTAGTELEVVPSHGQCGTGQDRRGNPVEQQLAEDRGDVDRAGGQAGGGVLPILLGLYPVDRIIDLVRHPGVDRSGEVSGPFGGRRQFDSLGVGFDLSGDVDHVTGQLSERLAERVGKRRGDTDTAVGRLL